MRDIFTKTVDKAIMTKLGARLGLQWSGPKMRNDVAQKMAKCQAMLASLMASSSGSGEYVPLTS